jgi:LemA protein
MLVYIIIGVVALLVIYLIAMYNGLIRLNVRANEAWSDITVQLKT